MCKTLDILFIPIPGTGHVNACIGLGEVLIQAGHTVSFVINYLWEGRLTKYGIKELLLTDEDPTKDPGVNKLDLLLKHGYIGVDMTPLERVKKFGNGFIKRLEMFTKLENDISKLLVSIPKPDVIVIDHFATIPCVELSSIPIVRVKSSNPLNLLDDDRAPPGGSGLSSLADPSEWKHYRDVRKQYLDTEPWIKYNEFMVLKGCPPLQENKFMYTHKYLNIYGYPLELDYLDLRPIPRNVIRFDNLKRTEEDLSFEIPVPLRDRPGKLVYFSMGSMGGVDVKNMKRLIDILSKSKHRFIVSKGPKHTEYELPDNMWGQQSVPQLHVLPLVDLVVTHGGNNTITETFYFGKPMILYKLMPKSLNILFIPIDGMGHVNACIGLAEVLIQAGHTVSFATNDQWEGRLTKYGIKELLFTDPDRPKNIDPEAHFGEMLIKRGTIGTDLTPLEKLRKNKGAGSFRNTEMFIQADKDIAELLATIPKPDVIVMDHFGAIPCVELSGIPIVWVCSVNPLFLSDDNRLPPSTSGLSAYADRCEWKAYRDAKQDATDPEIWIKYNEYMISKGCPPLHENKFYYHHKYLFIYGYPLELDYLDMRPLPRNVIRFDNLKRTEKHLTFEIPVQLRDRPGKLIYFSMGSMGGVDVKNMKRLIDIMSKSKHRFIVSKGPKHSEYELPDNMWGAATVPQIQVLPLVDLVITHGGNNTITETFYFGKPMIVLPLFADQYDNAQRVEDKEFGKRLNAYKCSESELLTAIESLLNNNELNAKLRKISSRIQSDNSIAKLPQIIEDFIQHKENYID
ncbi:unnamed protein product [Oppiella nova]|uniref:UDP-glycosyltransferase n=1 Tax=Oppiella nova TaxID=334625 RepID=A0A7R9QLU5_9ACAR|nr:unnamed protein product [Oppiella nova]CAG2167877.1 unnamed protein product [Oppiella nova]